MRAGIDITGLHWTYRTGVQNIYYGLIEGLLDLNVEDVDCFLIDRSGDGSHRLPLALSGHVQMRAISALGFLPTGNSRLTLWNRAVKSARRRMVNRQSVRDSLLGDLDVFHPWTWDAIRAPHAWHVITLTDVIPILFADLFQKEFVRTTQAGMEFARRHADRIIAISQFTKDELVRVAGLERDRISVIYLGVRAIFKPLGAATINAVRQRYNLHERPYVVSVGFLDPRKNVKGLVHAFEKLVADSAFRDLQLVLIGPPSFSSDQVLVEIQSAQVRDRIHVTGFVPDDDIVALVNGADAFAYCSLYEGFGLPVLEAMACGTPVVTSSTTALGEIGGDAAVLVAPDNVDTIVEGMARVLTDADLRANLRARGFERAKQFTWRNCAQEHLQVYREYGRGSE